MPSRSPSRLLTASALVVARSVRAVAAVPLFATLGRAQSEAALKKTFEGTMVVVKLDMPATEDGIDLYPGTASQAEQFYPIAVTDGSGGAAHPWRVLFTPFAA